MLAAVAPLAIGAPVGADVQPRMMAAELAVVDSLLAAGDHGGAAARAEALCAVAGDDPLYGWQARQRLGVALLRAERPQEALPYLEASATEALGDAAAHRNLATCLMALGRQGRALAEFQEAADLAPRDAAIRLDLGQALLRFGFYEEARPELSAADTLCGGCPQAARALATYHLETGAPAAAVRYLERVLAAGPDRQARLALAGAQIEADRPAAAAALLEELAPAELTAAEYRILLRADRALGLSERAAGWARGAGSEGVLPPEIVSDALFWAVVAEVCQTDDLLPEALLAIDAAVAASPRNAVYHVNRAALLQQLGRSEEAAVALERARAIDPGVVDEDR